MKENLLKSLFHSSSLTLLGKFFTFPIGIYVANIVGAEGYGYLGIAIVTAQFLSFSNIGILNGLNRELPIAKGRDTRESANEIYNAVYTFLCTSSLIALICIGLIYYFTGSILNVTEYDILLLISLIFLSGNIEGFLYNALKGEDQIKIWSIFVSIRPLLDSISSLIFVVLFGFKGLIFSLIISKLFASFILRNSYKGPRLRLIFNTKILDILRTCSIFMLINFLLTFFIKAPIFLTTGFLSVKEIGIIAFGISNLNIGEKFTGGQIFALNQRNRFAKIVGRDGISPEHIKFQITSKNFVYHLFLNGLLGGILGIIYFFIIQLFLDEFSALLSSLVCLSTFYFIWSITTFLHQILDLLKYLFTKMVLLSLGIVFMLISIYILPDLKSVELILNYYLISSVITLLSTYIFFLYIQKLPYIIFSLIKILLLIIVFYLALKTSTETEFGIFLLKSDYQYLRAFFEAIFSILLYSIYDSFCYFFYCP